MLFAHTGKTISKITLDVRDPKLMSVMSFYSHHYMHQIQDHKVLEEEGSMLEDELLVEVPGCAYSLADS